VDWSKFTLKHGKHTLATPCLEVVAFSYATPPDCGPGFAEFLRIFAGRFRGRLAFYRTGDMKRFRGFEDRALDGPYHWFSEDNILATKLLGFEVHSGDSQKNICPPALDMALFGFYDPPRFVFRMALPVEMGDTPDDVVSLVQEALSDFPLKSGHCGYSFIWEKTDPSLMEQVCEWAAPLLRRYPGLGYGRPVVLSNAADNGVVAVSWLTLLGPDITTDLGGRAALESQSPADVSVLPLGNRGTLLRAGDCPQLGDVNRQELLPEYRAVGHLVAPRRSTDDALDDLLISGMSDEDAHDWLRRFFV
jgi:hypothetical protein